MRERNAFGCIVFEHRLGQYYTCVEKLFYSAILFTSKCTDHVIAAKCPYDKIPFSGERGEKEIYIVR